MKKKRKISRTTLKILELQEPFEDDVPTDVKTMTQTTLHPLVVPTPKGGELVDPSWCDAPTRVQTDWECEALLDECKVA